MYMDKILQKYVTDGDIKKELKGPIYKLIKTTSSIIETSKPNLDGEDSVISILVIKIHYYKGGNLHDSRGNRRHSKY